MQRPPRPAGRARASQLADAAALRPSRRDLGGGVIAYAAALRPVVRDSASIRTTGRVVSPSPALGGATCALRVALDEDRRDVVRPLAARKARDAPAQ